jgi:genome maintenance exonuclease 1
MGRAARRGTATHNLIENYIKGEPASDTGVLPLGLFRLMKPYLDQINNIHMLETIMYSKELTVAGQVDCIAEFNGELSVIDFKTANKQRKEEWVESYFMQTTAYAQMYKELYGTEIKQIVILMACEDGAMQVFKKNTADYIEPLKKEIDYFYKYYEEQNRDKVKAE